jgi:hypothetical protein
MGYMRHHTIIVTAFDEQRAQRALAEARDVFDGITEVSLLVESGVNVFFSFVVPPDGSSEGWSESDAGDLARDAFIGWLNGQAYEDGSSPYSWVEVQYGDDRGDTRVIGDSGARRRLKIQDGRS